jgi:hypothetical protein
MFSGYNINQTSNNVTDEKIEITLKIKKTNLP